MAVSKHHRQDAMWGTLFTTFSNWFAGVWFTHAVVGTFARTCGCGFFGEDFLVRIFGCGCFSRILGCRFFRGFCDGLCGFWGADFFCGFFGLFSRRKSPEKSHQKILTKDLVQEAFPSQYTTTLLLAKHSRSPQSVWVQMHLIENRFLCADGVCRGG